MTKIVGILNITPDSFSDGGKFLDVKSAISHIEKMIGEGANIIDIGAQSTRPGAETLSSEQEWQKLEPILQEISKKKYRTKISIDSYHPQTIEKALDYGIDFINDVAGCKDAEMKKLAADSGKKIIFMHSLSVPADKNITIPENEDVINVIGNWLENKIAELSAAGIKKNNMIFDPGIGFGKTAKQSLEIIMNIEKFKIFGVEILVGHSEKSFLTLFTDKPAGQRGEQTKRFSKVLAAKEVDYIRVHDVAGNKSAVII